MPKKPDISDPAFDVDSLQDDKTVISPIETIDRFEVERTPALLMISGTQIGRSFSMEGKSEFRMGRAPHCELPLEDDLVSREHCKVVFHPDGRAELLDLQSTNGTLLNGRKVDRAILQEGDQIQVGSTTILKFHLQEEVESKFLGELYEAATRDFLTNAFNKRYFIERLQDEFSFAQRHLVDLSVLVVDIDHFKNINDTYGHLAGDVAIQKVAHHLLSHTRKDDLVARFGGEEFVILTRDMNLEKAKNLGESMRKGISQIEVVSGRHHFQLTVSIGVACFATSEKPNFQSFQSFLDHADKQLYAAKRSGRNRVCA